SICTRCIARQIHRSYSVATPARSPPPPPSSGASKLTNRRLISLRGHEAPKFLQGLITNNVRPASTSGFYAAFLTAQGKVLHDAFVYPTVGSSWQKYEGGEADEPGYLVEIDAEQVDVIMKHLKRHKLRSKFKLRLLDNGELNVWSLWKEGERWTSHSQPQSSSCDDRTISLTDRRAPSMGHRLILPDDTGSALEDVEEASLSAYTMRRYLRGVAEGQKEMPRDDCLPLNCNIDIMGGIDFKKGCYLGQELTIRTHHTGVVRRRILPVVLHGQGTEPPEKLEYDPSLSINVPDFVGQDLRKDDKSKRSTGKFIGGIGNIGLAMCRLEQMTDLTISGEPSPFTPEDKFTIRGASGKD
ncbi:hypothetical protein DOTSEDRAFT_114226, partial [Dothistroma septosporum NZE10]